MYYVEIFSLLFYSVVDVVADEWAVFLELTLYTSGSNVMYIAPPLCTFKARWLHGLTWGLVGGGKASLFLLLQQHFMLEIGL